MTKKKKKKQKQRTPGILEFQIHNKVILSVKKKKGTSEWHISQDSWLKEKVPPLDRQKGTY